MTYLIYKNRTFYIQPVSSTSWSRTRSAVWKSFAFEIEKNKQIQRHTKQIKKQKIKRKRNTINKIQKYLN